MLKLLEPRSSAMLHPDARRDIRGIGTPAQSDQRIARWISRVGRLQSALTAGGSQQWQIIKSVRCALDFLIPIGEVA